MIVNSGSLEEVQAEEIVDIYEIEDPDYEYEDLPDRSGKKKKEKNCDYTKMAKAIGNIIEQGISISLIDINNSDFGFKPDIRNNRILYGMKALSGVNSETIKKIKDNRPYYGIADFMKRCPLNKKEMINLIKAGAFDSIDTDFDGDRKKIMAYYISKTCDAKKELNLRNFNGLIQYDIVPEELTLQVRVFNFNKYLKAARKVGQYYTFDESCNLFFEKFLNEYIDNIEIINGITCILQTKWDKIYQKQMDPARNWLKEKQTEVLKQYNLKLFKEMWDKYASGSLSHWEMESLCFYYSGHELADVDLFKYGIVDFNSLNPESEIETFFVRNKNKIPIYKLSRIAGTVIAKNDNKSIVTILTTTGVVDVKFTREYYAMFKTQISEIDLTGKKHVVEKGWFTRGTMLMVTGFRREDTFVGKTYKTTNSHQLYKIVDIKGKDIVIQHERFTKESDGEYED